MAYVKIIRGTGRCLAVFLSSVFIGCGQEKKTEEHLDSSALTVFSGVGIPGICSVSMDMDQIRELHKDVRAMKGSNGLLLPSLGAICLSHDKGKTVTHIEFYVMPVTNDWLSYRITKPFAGNLNGTLSFGAGRVTREDVEAVFSALPVVVSADEVPYFVHGHLPFNHSPTNGEGKLYHPRRGISVDFDKEGVRSFSVFKPEIQGWRGSRFWR